MNAIRVAITLFIVLLIVISVIGWRWTGAHQPAAQAAASHLVLGVSILAGAAGMIAIWRGGAKGRSQGSA